MFPVTVADYISRAESQSRQNLPQKENHAAPEPKVQADICTDTIPPPPPMFRLYIGYILKFILSFAFILSEWGDWFTRGQFLSQSRLNLARLSLLLLPWQKLKRPSEIISHSIGYHLSFLTLRSPRQQSRTRSTAVLACSWDEALRVRAAIMYLKKHSYTVFPSCLQKNDLILW